MRAPHNAQEMLWEDERDVINSLMSMLQGIGSIMSCPV